MVAGSEMRVLMMVVVAVGIAICLISPVAYADDGTATFYTPPYIPSACYGNSNDNGIMIAAASDAFWDDSAACGKIYRVRCTGATNNGVPHPCRRDVGILVKIVDYCPPGCAGTIDLSQEAFTLIADPDAGKIKVEYTEV